MLTYCPGRKPTGPAPSSEKASVVSDSRSTEATVAWRVSALVLHMAEDAAMSITRSVFATAWQARAKPSAASSSVSASSM